MTSLRRCGSSSLGSLSASSAASGPLMRKSTSSWQLSALGALSPEEEEEEQQQRQHAAAKRQKPPRHSSVPMCAQILLGLWQRVLQRADVSITSDFFYDLDGSDEQALDLVERMQRMGFNISAPQFFSLPRSSIYTVLLVAL